MPGDLNLKKSWHPGLAKNQAKVKQKEEEALRERQKIAERQKEIEKERYASELLAIQGKETSRLGWMYRADPGAKSATSEATKDDYLLGKKKVDEEFFEEVKKTKHKESISRQELQKRQSDPMAAILARKKSRAASKNKMNAKSK